MDIKEIKWEIKWYLPKMWHWYVVRPIRRVKMICAYIKQAWNTEDWDFCYLLEDMAFKMNRIKSQIKQNDILDPEGVVEIERQIKEVTDLIDKEKMGSFYDHIPSVRVETIPVEGKPYSELKFLPPEGMTEEERRKLYEEAFKKEMENWDKIFDLLKTYMRNWWD